MPYSLWNNLSLPELTQLAWTLELAGSDPGSPLVLGRCFLKQVSFDSVYGSILKEVPRIFQRDSGTVTFFYLIEAIRFLTIEVDPNSSEVDPTYQDMRESSDS
ncbi:hypothetical protein Tco_0564989 [Tanacetum coccineum]